MSHRRRPHNGWQFGHACIVPNCHTPRGMLRFCQNPRERSNYVLSCHLPHLRQGNLDGLRQPHRAGARRRPAEQALPGPQQDERHLGRRVDIALRSRLLPLTLSARHHGRGACGQTHAQHKGPSGGPGHALSNLRAFGVGTLAMHGEPHFTSCLPETHRRA